MNRKIRVIILTLVLTVLMFGGTRLMAQNENNAVDPQTTPTEENLESKNEGEKGASLVEEGKNTDIDSNEAEAKEDAGKTETTEAEANKNEKTEVNETKSKEDAPKEKEEEKTEANADAKPAAKEAEKPAEKPVETPDVKPADKTAAGNGPEDGAKLQAAPAKVPETQGAPAGEGNGTGTDPTPAGGDKKQVDPNADEELKALQDQIKAEKDPKKKAELQKQYNEKYLEKVEAAGADKLDKEVLKRFTDKERTDEFYKLQAEYEALKKKAEAGKLTQKEIDDFNKKLGGFKPPRKLDADEEAAQKKLADSVDVKGLQNDATADAEAKLKAYNEAKKALQAALDAEKTEGKAENLAALVDAFEKAEKALKEGIENGKIKPSYTDGKPTVRVFPLVNGSLGDELKEKAGEDKTYYIPDNTDINLLIHVNKDDTPKEFTFKIKAAEKGVKIDGEKASNLAFLNGKPVELIYDEKTDSYSFTVNSDKTFGIAQLRFNVPGFEGPFHKGFDLEMDLGNNNTVTKKFRITKKGYEDEAHLNGPGSDKADDPTKIPEVDAGDTENAKVKEDSAKEVYDFFTYLKKSNTYIDKVTFNSGNGESLPLDSVDITITIPKSGENNFAEMIHKSGLEYHKLEDGKYQLKLDRKVFGGNLKKEGDKLYLTDKDGNNTGKELTKATITDAILENAGKKVYVDKDEKAHDIITSEVLEKDGYKVENGKLYHKADASSEEIEIGTFDKDGKIEKDGKTYILKDNKLISYTKEYDVYEGNVVNKDGKADPNVTPTYEGNQVTIVTEVDKNGTKTTETSYGGTIVQDAIYDKNGKIFNEEGYKEQPGDQVIDSTGKKADDVTIPTEGITEVKDDNENLLYKYFVDGGKTYRIVKDAVFKGDYIVDGLEYKKGLSLIDKFGKKMNIEVKEQGGKYTFTRKVKDGDKEVEKKITSGKDGDKRNIKVEDGQILVNSKNEVVNDPDGKYKKIGPKYYYDGKEFAEAKGDDLKGNKLQGNKFFVGFAELQLDPIVKHYYKDGDNNTEIKDFDKKAVYEGSLKPEDYFKVDEKVYVKKSQGAGNTAAEYYVSADPNASNEILSEKKIAKIVQTLGEGKNAIEKVTDETDIFDAVQNAKFALKFPGFFAGKNIVYNVHADVKATYKEPKQGKEGEFVEKSIFKDGKKEIDKFFTLKNEKTTNTTFFKHAPKELQADPAVNLHFFNIFYRNADDRERDQLIADLLEIEEKVNKAEADVDKAAKDDKKAKQEAYEKLKNENKEKLELLAKFKYELGRVKTGAKFIIKVDSTKDQTNGPVYVKDDKGNIRLFIVGEDGKEIEADELNKMRSLLWEVGFENTEGSLFPENPDTEIIIEDHNMDNRLIYDEIIVNDTRENWDKLNKAHEDAGKKVAEAEKALKENKDESKKAELEASLEAAKKALEKAKFKGTKEYFFLDQIKDIRFGVNPNYINGRFVPLGKDFKITGQEIIDKLKENPNEKSVEIEKGEGENKIKFLVTRDEAIGQVRIKVIKVFYKKVENDSTRKFYSPAQEAYQKKIDGLLKEVDELNEKNIEEFVKTLHDDTSECFGIIKEKLKEEFEKVKNKPEELKNFKKDLKAEIKKIKLEYLDKSKHIENEKSVYKFDDMRFNAIRIGLNPNITIGGAMNPENTKKIGITSVIVPEIDIPYTDEFGNLLTNKDMCVKSEIENILKNGIEQGKDKPKLTFDKDTWYKSEDTFIQVMKEAYKRVNENKKIKIEYLVTIEKDNKDKVGMEKYTAVNGSVLKLNDLAVDGKVLKNKDGFAINPWFIDKGDKVKSIDQIFKEKFGEGKFEKMPEYLKLKEMPIDIAAYYMSKQGYNRSKYANQANYKLSGGDKKDGIFGSDSDWHKKICYPGLGHCIEQAGKNPTDGKNPDQGKFGAEDEKAADFELTYEPTNKGPDKENPKTDKSSTAPNDGIDITGEEDKKVDFNIYVTVDKMTKEQKDIADALTPEKPEKPKKPEAEMTDEEKKAAEEEKKAAEAEKKAKEIEAGNYNKETGYYEYKNSLIIDFLPEIFKLKQGENGTKLTLTIDREKLMANDANKAFEDEKKFDEWKNGIEYFYTDDLEAYAKTLTDKEKAEVLNKAIADAKASGKIKEGQKVQAVLAWVPTFEAPHGSKEQFKFELKNVYVDKKKFKDFDDKVIGTNYTNHAAFGDKARFYFGETTVNINKDKHGKVNKYLQLLDKDGNIIDKDKADGWFTGGAELKFGDKFKYRIEYHNNTGVVAVPGEANNKSEIKLEDLFATVDKKGLRPVLNGFITSDLKKYEVIYKIGNKEYSESELKAEIKANKVKISDVTSVILKGNFDNGATKHFDIPMMIPNLDAKVENGKVYYIGKDNEKHELGEAKDFFNLKDLTDKEKDLIAENKVDGSNTVTVYLDKERFIRVFKEFLAANGEKLKNLDNLEAKFDVYQIIEENGVKKRVKVGELKANKANDFTDMLDHLPIFKKTTTIDKDGNVKVNEIKYEYELEEAAMPGFESKVYKLDDTEGLGFVWQATNTEKPENPGDHPHDNPKNVKVKISVNKVWKVLNNGETPSIQVELYANGKATGKIITLGADGSWSASFEDLPAKDKDGKDIIYSVREVGEAKGITKIGDRSFEVSYSDADGVFTIINKEVPPENPEEPTPEEPEHPENPEHPEHPQDNHVIPKTGVNEDLGAIYFALVLLLGLVFIKKRYLVK